MNKPFEGMEPTKYIWVSPSGSDTSDGSQGSPLQTIQAAVDLSKTSAYGPGTAIMVRAGTYNETVNLFQAGGSSTAPVWIISADGPGKATVVADATGNAFTGNASSSNMVIRGFNIDGGDADNTDDANNGDGNAIMFTSTTGTVSNVVIENNHIYGCSFDGLKFTRGDNIWIENNTIDHSIETTPPSKQEGIDFFHVKNSYIGNNHIIGGSTLNSGITVKNESENILIEHNHIHDVGGGAGIKIGGNGNSSLYTHMAKDVTVTENHVHDTSDASLVFVGAVDSTAHHNNVENVRIIDYNSIQTDNLTFTDNHAGSNTWISNPAGATYTETGTAANSTWTGEAGVSEGFYDPIHGTVASPFRDVTGWQSSGAPTNYVYGTNGVDVLTGTSGNDEINGRLATDTMTGYGGDDTYVVSGAADVVVENAGEGIDTVRANGTAYTLAANVENLLVNATTGYAATGNGLDNIIVGNVGAETIKGRGGEDRLTGGAGADVFVYEALADKGDVITDFQSGVDSIDLTALTGGLTGATQVYSTVQSDGVTLFVDNGGQHHALVHLLGVTTTLAAGSDFFY